MVTAVRTHARQLHVTSLEFCLIQCTHRVYESVSLWWAAARQCKAIFERAVKQWSSSSQGKPKFHSGLLLKRQHKNEEVSLTQEFSKYV